MDLTSNGFKSDSQQQQQSFDEQINFNHSNDESNFVFNLSESLNNHSSTLCPSPAFENNNSANNQNNYQNTQSYSNINSILGSKCSNQNNESSTITSNHYINNNECNNRNQNFEQINNLNLNSTDSFKRDEEVKESILMAISQMNLCEAPLKRKVFESLLQEKQQNFHQPINQELRFRQYMQIESSSTLYPIEQKKLEELREACVLLRNPYKQIVNETNHLPDAIQLTEAAICRLIKMSNRLSSFNRLYQSDQISLLKHSIIEMFCIRATTNFNSENNFWYFIDDNNQGLSLVSMEVLKAAQINFMSHKNFAIKFNSQFRNDSMIADLLTAIILFRPSRAKVSNLDVVREEFLNYCYLLKRYLQVKHKGDSCSAKSSFVTLMHRLEELHHLSEDIVRLYLDLNPENAGQLFVELFDLK